MPKIAYPEGAVGTPLEDVLKGSVSGGESAAKSCASRIRTTIIDQSLGLLAASTACLTLSQIEVLRYDLDLMTKHFEARTQLADAVTAGLLLPFAMQESIRHFASEWVTLARLQCRECLRHDCTQRDPDQPKFGAGRTSNAEPDFDIDISPRPRSKVSGAPTGEDLGDFDISPRPRGASGTDSE